MNDSLTDMKLKAMCGTIHELIVSLDNRVSKLEKRVIELGVEVHCKADKKRGDFSGYY